MTRRRSRLHPELRLLGLALPVELLWEVAQFPLYDIGLNASGVYRLYALLHCTLGDLLILIASYALIAFLNRNRRWYATHPIANGLLFTLLSATYTALSEIANVRAGNWGYTERMPIMPWLSIGTTPRLQWLLIPPLLLWLMRRTAPPPSQPY